MVENDSSQVPQQEPPEPVAQEPEAMADAEPLAQPDTESATNTPPAVEDDAAPPHVPAEPPEARPAPVESREAGAKEGDE